MVSVNCVSMDAAVSQSDHSRATFPQQKKNKDQRSHWRFVVWLAVNTSQLNSKQPLLSPLPPRLSLQLATLVYFECGDWWIFSFELCLFSKSCLCALHDTDVWHRSNRNGAERVFLTFAAGFLSCSEVSKCESCDSKSENGRTVSWILATRIAGVSPSVTMHNVSPLLIHAIIHGKWTSPHPTPPPHSLPHPSHPSPLLAFPRCLVLVVLRFHGSVLTTSPAQFEAKRGERSLYFIHTHRLCIACVFVFFLPFLFFSLSNPVIYTEKNRNVSSASSHSLFDFPRCNAAEPLGGSHFSPPFFSRWKRRKSGEL